MIENTHGEPIDEPFQPPIKVTVNLNPNDPIQLSQWSVDDKNDRRIGFEFGGLSYSFILSTPIKMEVYDLDENGDIGDILHTQEIKVASRIHHLKIDEPTPSGVDRMIVSG